MHKSNKVEVHYILVCVCMRLCQIYQPSGNLHSILFGSIKLWEKWEAREICACIFNHDLSMNFIKMKLAAKSINLDWRN